MISVMAPDRARPGETAENTPNLEEWIDQYGDGLLRMCVMYLGDYALAEDALQETFVRAYAAYERFEHRCSIKTWLTTIAANICKTMLKSAWNRKTVSIETIGNITGMEEAVPDGTVYRAVMKLPPDLREVILLHQYQGMKLREIARMRNLPMTTVTSRLNRAKKHLRRELKEWYFDEE